MRLCRPLPPCRAARLPYTRGMGWEARIARQRRAEQEVKVHRVEKRAVGTQNRLRAEEDARTGMSRNAAAQVRPARLDQTAEEQRAEKEKRAAKKEKSQQFRQQAKLYARGLEADATEASEAPDAAEAPEVSTSQSHDDTGSSAVAPVS